MEKHIIPIFVPYQGKMADNIFCNKETFNQGKNKITKEDIETTVKDHLKEIKDEEVEVFFYGGSFTSLDIEKQEEFLKTVFKYIQNKKIEGIKIFSSPEFINKKILKLLKKYNVKTIELGVNSTNNYILQRAKIGYTFEDIKTASKLIKRYRFKLGYQIMVGLPESTKLDEIKTAKDLAKFRPKIVKIYPLLVKKGTELEKEYNENMYTPLTIVQAVETSKEIVRIFLKKKTKVIRVKESIQEENDIVAGPFHPEFRQLVESSLWYDAIVNKIKELNVKVLEVKVDVNPIDVNSVIGYKNENINKLKETYDVDLIVTSNENIKQGKSKIEITKTYKDFKEE